jgi:hypothetical protein
VPIGMKLGDGGGAYCKYGKFIFDGEISYPKTIKSSIMVFSRECAEKSAEKEQLLAALVNPTSAATQVGARFATCLTEKIGSNVHLTKMEIQFSTMDWSRCNG